MNNVSSMSELQWRKVLTVTGLLLLLAVLAPVLVEAADHGKLDPNRTQPCAVTDPRMDPTYEEWHGQDVIWQIPPNPKAVLFLAHGGDRDALSFFDPGPKCERCSGMPEDRAVVLNALDRGYAVIVLKSVNCAWEGWPPDGSRDVMIATTLIKKWTREHSLEHLPLAAWGHSAGAFFVTILTLKLHIRALVAMCAAGQAEVLENATPSRFPPTFFAYMPVDRGSVNSTGRVEWASSVLTERGVQVRQAQIWPKRLSPHFFVERIRCMDDTISEKIYAAYKAEGWLDNKSYLTKDPEQEDWESVLQKSNSLPVCRKSLPSCKQSGDLCLAPQVQQELTVAYGVHGFSSDADGDIFPWMDSIIRSLGQPVPALFSSR